MMHNLGLKPVSNMSIDELRLQKKRKMYRSHHHLNFGPVKVAKYRKVFFIFDPILGWLG